MVRVRERLGEPRAGEGPLAIDLAWRDAQRQGGLVHAAAREEAEAHDHRRLLVHLGQAGEGLVEREDRVGVLVLGQIEHVGGHAQRAAWRAERTLPILEPGALGPRVIDEDAAHRLGRGVEEVGPPVPGDVALGSVGVGRSCVTTHELGVRLVHERGGLERVAGMLGVHPLLGEGAELLVDEREQLGRGLGIAGSGGVEQVGHVGSIRLLNPFLAHGFEGSEEGDGEAGLDASLS